ncbi:MAG: regulatory protein RecX [Spirochaetes bacterium]|nr:regulatory protein RecX [Spirochaetota bacterium]
MQEENSSSPRGNLTVISVQKRGAAGGFYRVGFSDGSSLFLLKDILLKAGIFKGDEVERKTLPVLEEQSKTLEAERKALNLLSHSMHTRKGLKLKLMQRGFSEDIIDKALKRVEELGYIDDAKFAETWLASRITRHPEGRLALISHLMQKGVERALAESTVNELCSRQMELECARTVLNKLTKLTEKKKLNRQILFSKLYRKGFSYEIINTVMED